MALDLETLDTATAVAAATTYPPIFRVDVRHGEPGAVVLNLVGEADLATEPQLSTALTRISDDDTANVVLDVSRLAFIDAHCLGVIAQAGARLHTQGRDLMVRSPAPSLRRLLTLVQMDGFLEDPHTDRGLPAPHVTG